MQRKKAKLNIYKITKLVSHKRKLKSIYFQLEEILPNKLYSLSTYIIWQDTLKVTKEVSNQTQFYSK